MRKAILLVPVLLLPPTAAVVVPEVRRAYAMPRRFSEVIPAGLYRGGRPDVDDIRRLRTERSIRSVVALTEDRPEDAPVLAEIRRLGILFRRFPMPGDGVADFATLCAAADALADRGTWPVYFHCAAGKQRSNAVLAAYRIRHCRWSAEQALRELEERYDLDRVKEARLCERIRSFAAQLTASRGSPTP